MCFVCCVMFVKQMTHPGNEQKWCHIRCSAHAWQHLASRCGMSTLECLNCDGDGWREVRAIGRMSGRARYIDSNWSTRCLVLPWRICLSVLYLSRPWATFCSWRRSLRVTRVSSLFVLSSSFSDWKPNKTKHFNFRSVSQKTSGIGITKKVVFKVTTELCTS